MPIYEYRCDACGAEFEELVFSREEQVGVVCRKCQSPDVVKLMSGAAVGHGAPSLSCEGPGCDYKPRQHSCGGGCGCGG
jgi:putative FmdB family regulatory protein